MDNWNPQSNLAFPPKTRHGTWSTKITGNQRRRCFRCFYTMPPVDRLQPHVMGARVSYALHNVVLSWCPEGIGILNKKLATLDRMIRYENEFVHYISRKS